MNEVCLTGRFFDATEAKCVGLVSNVYDTKDEMTAAAYTLAAVIASKSPVATLGIKNVLNYSRGLKSQSNF